MKIKFLSFAFALVMAVMLSACSSGPSGDPAKDAKQCATEMIDLMNKDIKTLDDVKNLETEVEAIQKKYEDFYKEKGEDQLKKFNEEVAKLENDAELKKQIEDAQNKMMENVTKIMGEESKSE
jgi:uncharacterized protein YlxW (UPF0749 family)